MRNHNGAWTELPTVFDHQTPDAYYFNGRTPGFLFFAMITRRNEYRGNVTAVATLPSLTSGIAAAPFPGAQPEANHTMAAPVGGTGPGFLFLPVIAGIAGIIIVVIGWVFLRRWWIRKQNPVLFRKYD